MSDTRKRLLLVRSYLLEHTNEQHATTLKELIAYLECEGIAADSRGIFADLVALKENGLDIRTKRGRYREYYIGEGIFERGELRLLTDMVLSSQFLTQTRADALVQKLAALTNRWEAASLKAHTCRNPRRSICEDTFSLVERILSALELRRKLSFLYCEYATSRVLTPKKDASHYIVSPYLLIYTEDHYFLVADHPTREGLVHYRLDRMKDVHILKDPAAPRDASFDAIADRGSTFPLSPAELRWVRLAFDRSLIDAMIDRFGCQIPMAQLSERIWVLYAPIPINNSFFGWVFQFGGGVRILEPDDVRERMLLMLEAARKSAD